jgi:gamma-glutamylcyclotransferase (GGCT)/AIG2-like uncharacterized protein YtfP
MKYFAYGSNMSKERMNDRDIEFSQRTLAKLTGYKLVFNKKSRQGIAANIEQSEPDFIEGILYEFADDQIKKLDIKEGYPSHYDRIQIAVTVKGGYQVEAVTYVAREDKIVMGLHPTKAYLGYLLAGEDILSKEYLYKLSQIETCD